MLADNFVQCLKELKMVSVHFNQMNILLLKKIIVEGHYNKNFNSCYISFQDTDNIDKNMEGLDKMPQVKHVIDDRKDMVRLL